MSKSETVEEVLREEYDLKVINSDLDNVYLNGLIEGAKWQAERMYTEEQVREAISKSISILVGQEINLAQLKELTIQSLKQTKK